MIHVFLRTCDKIENIHIQGRPYGLKKKEIIKICFRSLMRTMVGLDWKLTIIADDISEETLKFFQEEGKEDQVIIADTFGNDKSLLKMFDLAKDLDDEDIIYFLEDDYLHTNMAGWAIKDLFDGVPRDFFVHPTDYPDQYFRKDLLMNTPIFLTKYCHWRSVSASTFTFLCKGKIAKKYMAHFKSSCVGADDGFLSQLFKDTPCIAPIPGLVSHMHEGTMSPFVDWEKLVSEYNEKRR